MLLELHIARLGVIDDVTLDLAPGLNVLTGETGAGKTMVTVGLALVLGRRARSGLVRSGAGKARVEARFGVGESPASAGSLEEWAEDGELVLARTVSEDGRSTARAGGQLSPLSTLADLGAGLVELHGQHQTQRLLSPAAHLAFLDRYCGSEHLARATGYGEVFGALREARSRLARLEEESREREREKDLLAYQVREIEAAGLRPGEVADLRAEESRLAHAERIRDELARARAALDEEGGGADALREAQVAVGEAAEVDPGLEELAGRLRSLTEEAADAAVSVRDRAESVELDPARLEEVRSRIAAIRGLERKYGEDEEGVLAFLDRTRSRLEELGRSGEEAEKLGADADRLEADAGSLASAMGETRRAAAPRLAGALQEEMGDLGMEGARVIVDLGEESELGPSGRESAELRFSAGPGQEALPLPRVASGGELSRTMLACRTVLADLDEVPTLVFDEVDSGIGGRAGVAVGRRLSRLGQSRQVLVVTHLPQIACFADRHFRVTKARGTAGVAPLEGPARIEELSRMLSGMPTDEAASHAEQLLAEAAREKA
jgi:DNA repair protein RecN (Recombination protein N)